MAARAAGCYPANMSQLDVGRSSGDLQPRVLDEHYRIQRKLADGGMSTVYVADSLASGRTVALKIANPGGPTDERQLVERARLEAIAIGRCDHPHVVKLLEAGPTHDGGFFLALEFHDAPVLSHLLRSEPISVERSVKLAIQIAAALAHVHGRGAVHRDVKAANVLVGRDARGQDHVTLLDFGLVHLLDRAPLPQEGVVLGSVHTMAPEQIKTEDVDHRADIYALGVLLYRMLSGRYPFQARHRTEVLAAHLHGEVPHFASFAPHLTLPAGLEPAVRRCLAKRPEDRYPTMADLISDLEGCVSVPENDFLTVTFGTDTIPRIRRAIAAQERGTRAVALAAVAIALVALGIALWAALY